MTTKRIVVLGAGGFIGRRIVSAMASAGWAHPVAALRAGSRSFGAGVESVAVDATSATSIAAVTAGADGVVNAIAGDTETLRSNGLALFGQPSADSTVPIVHLSTMSVYGSAEGDIDEQAPLLGDLGPYSAAKAEVEKMAARHTGVVILRPGIVYGPGSPLWSRLIGRLLVEQRLGDLGPAGLGICNLVHVDDVARAVLAALTTPACAGSAFNLSLSEPPTWNDYFRAYGTALGSVPVKSVSANRLAVELKILGPLLKICEIVTSKAGLPEPSPPLRPWLINQCRHKQRLVVSAAEQKLGLSWLPLARGLEETAAWFHAAKGVKA